MGPHDFLELAFVSTMALPNTHLELTSPRTKAPVDEVICRAEGCAKICMSRRAYRHVSLSRQYLKHMLT
jgi:hypothetical protein